MHCTVCHQILTPTLNETTGVVQLVGPDDWGTVCGDAPAGEHVPADPMARARELEQALFYEMTLENTPAAFMDDRYDYDDDVWMADQYGAAGGSPAVEKRLTLLVQALPDVFAGTDFAPYLAADLARDFKEN